MLVKRRPINVLYFPSTFFFYGDQPLSVDFFAGETNVESVTALQPAAIFLINFTIADYDRGSRRDGIGGSFRRSFLPPEKQLSRREKRRSGRNRGLSNETSRSMNFHGLDIYDVAYFTVV